MKENKNVYWNELARKAIQPNNNKATRLDPIKLSYSWWYDDNIDENSISPFRAENERVRHTAEEKYEIYYLWK